MKSFGSICGGHLRKTWYHSGVDELLLFDRPKQADFFPDHSLQKIKKIRKNLAGAIRLLSASYHLAITTPDIHSVL